ncbi:MAG TPA: hypothetical protein PLD30_09150 [Candidatus Competibacteraceae bacterium]|nr:hypothetical protein [Candidatus Competibacteraceae bacterium]
MSIWLDFRMDCRGIAIHFLLLTILFLSTSFPATAATAQQDGDPHPSAQDMTTRATSGPRTSPFDPPEKDSFIADSGPGLDTGCTFNSSPPLTIDVMIDRAVGPVDAQGYLVDAAPLIAQGIIPSSVYLSMPAYDVDVNGAPPPERDEVAFNGENIGLLTGDNNVWKFNSFSVPITKVKFPAPPAPGAAPVPRANRIVITVDTLASNRWCTAIDWVALTIPVKPKLALTLEPVAGASNPIRQNSANDLISVIYKQTTDANCNVQEDIGPIDAYPFSGPSESGLSGSGEAKVRTKVAPCPAGSLPDPEVTLKWSIAGTALQGTKTWSGLEGEATLTMPSVIGAYNVTFEYTIDGETLPTITRKLYVTKRSPTLNAPRLSWYKHATSWASGLSDETAILKNLLSGLYAYGQANWRYGYQFGPVIKCRWEDLAADPISCNYSDCYVFSDIFENMAGTLGVSGLIDHRVYGAKNKGFITTGSPSLDPRFTGNARPFTATTYDRYRFSSHSLRKRGAGYYDATFNGIYLSDTAFISWNIDGKNSDLDGPYDTTIEGAKIYEITGTSAYDSWGAYKYKAPSGSTGSRSLAVRATHMAFTSSDAGIPGTAAYTPLDTNGDGIYEALIADIDIDIVTPGTYTVRGILMKNGQAVATQPSFDVAIPTQDTVGGQPPYTATLQFSGEQIFQSGVNGPYDLEVVAFASGGTLAVQTLTTPAYDHTQFGERSSRINSASDSATDTDGDNRYDYLAIDVDVSVLNAGTYVLQGTLLKDGNTIVNTSETLTAGAGSQTLSLKFPGVSIFRSGQNGPYEAVIALFNANGERQDDIEFLTQPYDHTQFEGLLDLTGAFNAQGIDTNGNSLYDLLRVNFGADVRAAGNFLMSAALKNPVEPLTVYADVLVSLSAGPQTMTINFSGPEINSQGIDGPYVIEVSLRDPNTHEELDRVALSQSTAAYSHMDFDPLGGPSLIKLTGHSTDQGIDNNGNGLYDLLKVSVEVNLTNTGSYVWSARLADIQGTEIGFDSRNGFLNAGTRTIDFYFNGRSIGQNGIAGPYYVKGLLMSGPAGANLVSSEVTRTQAYNAEAFEGFVVPQKGDIDGDGDVDLDDMNAVLAARNTPASGPNDPRDLDGDGMITALDARQLRLLCSRPNCATQ